MRRAIVEDEVEQMTLELLEGLGYEVIHGPDIAPESASPERESYTEVILKKRLKQAIYKINPHLPNEAKDEAIKKALRAESPKLLANNEAFHKMLVDGIEVEYRENGRIKGDIAWLIDYQNPKNNEFLAVNQFTIISGKYNRRPDVILFINGLPLVVIELKNPADKNATITSAYNQIETYKLQIQDLFTYNSFCIISDGLKAAAGTITSKRERFMPWKTVDGEEIIEKGPQLPVLIRGMLPRERLLDIIRHFIAFDEDTKGISKKIAAYHQYHAANKAMQATLQNAKPRGDGRAGVVWHTQGSGKSLTMVFYAGKLILEHDNPTIVILTDRNDLDDQLFQTFANCQQLLRQKPEQANSRTALRKLLKRSSGGVIFTTIQKFFPEEKGDLHPELSGRSNIVVVADEAHRSQYGFEGKVSKTEDEAFITYGFAKHLRDALPNASFIGFTGTPIEKDDKSTPAVFGKYVDTYDFYQAIKDGATVTIFHENRLVRIGLKPEERPHLDERFEQITESEEEPQREKLKTKWARTEKIIGSKRRIQRIAKDLVEHFEQRIEVLEGKGMVVCMSRRIAVELHDAIVKLRPQWYHEDDEQGFMKVIMTGAANDPQHFQEHIRNKQRRRKLGERMKDPDDPLKLVIVRDMWLTGFDVPSLHTMYIDKPMQGHTLMQAIARVNRVFKDKNGGLVVDYLGIAPELRKALNSYAASGGKGKPIVEKEEAVTLMLENYEIVKGMFTGFNFSAFFTSKGEAKLGIIPNAIEHILQQKDGKKRYLKNVTKLAKAYSLAVPHEEAEKIREDVAFFRAVRSAMVKATVAESEQHEEQLESAIKQLVSRAIISDRVVDIFAAAGMKKPDISILSEDFLNEVKDLPQKNLAFETLKKLLNDEIAIRSKKNLVQARSFTELLEQAIRRYQNRSIETAEVIEELIRLAHTMKEADKKGDDMGLTEDEVAFYDALAENQSAVEVLGEAKLAMIAKELADIIRKETTIDWTVRESVQSRMRVLVKRLLRKYGYPPDQQEKATETVLEQAKLLSADLAQV